MSAETIRSQAKTKTSKDHRFLSPEITLDSCQPFHLSVTFLTVAWRQIYVMTPCSSDNMIRKSCTQMKTLTVACVCVRSAWADDVIFSSSLTSWMSERSDSPFVAVAADVVSCSPPCKKHENIVVFSHLRHTCLYRCRIIYISG